MNLSPRKIQFTRDTDGKQVRYSSEQIYNSLVNTHRWILCEVFSIEVDSDGIWIYLSDKYTTSYESHTIHEHSIRAVHREVAYIKRTQYRKQAQ